MRVAGIAGQAADAAELLEIVDGQRPDVAIVDIRMPPTHTDVGLGAARDLRSRYPALGVLALPNMFARGVRSSCCTTAPGAWATRSRIRCRTSAR